MGLFSRKKEPEVRECPAVEKKEESLGGLAALLGQYKVDLDPEAISAWFAAKELISNSFAQLPILIKRDNKRLEDHNLESLFTTNLLSKFILMKKTIEDIIDFGQALFYIRRKGDGTPVSLMYCPWGTYSVNYTYGGELYYTINKIRKKVEPINVLHFYKNPDDNGVIGIKLSALASRILHISSYTDKAASDYYKTGGAYNGVLMLKGARKEAVERVVNELRNADNGRVANRTLVIDNDMDYKATSADAAAAQLMESRLFNVTEIARYFNINPVLLGDLSKSSYNTIEMAQIEFTTHTLMPYISLWECEVNRKLVKPSEKGITIDLDETYLMRGDSRTQAANISTYVNTGVYSRNHARSILGLEPIEGLDEILIPYTDINANKLTGNTDADENIDDKKDE